jgi:CheY-like chemotaxis protein
MLGSRIAVGRPLCVLHVDDHVVNRRLVQDVLVGSGHTAVAAESGELALEFLAHQSFDVVLMDINLPSMNGIEVVRQLRGSVGRGRDTPVIALTSEVRRTKEDYLALGFNGYVTKPFSIANLLQAIHDCTRPRPARVARPPSTGFTGSAA